MLNRKELVQSIKVMKGEYAEALAKGNERLANQMVDEILRLEVITKEEIENKALAELSKEVELTFDVEEEEALNQSSLIASFKKQLKECYNKKLNTTKSPISDRQLDTILAGMRDRVGLDINQEQIAFIKGFNMNQASALISVLNGISFYNQRVQLTKSLEILKNREDFAMIIEEVKRNIHKKAWFDANDDLLRMSRELQEPTDAQIRRIANVAKYIETHHTLLSDFNIDVHEYEQRPEDKLYYVFNYNALKEDIRVSFNREEASNFIQTYDYINNLYEGIKLEDDQIKHIRGLYIRLGEYEKTKMTYLMTLRKDYYDTIVKDLEERVRLNQVANNLKDNRIRQAMGQNPLVKRSKYTRETRSITLKKEQQEAKEMCDFVFGIYSCIGQEVPEEMNRILPYFIERGETVYASIEEVHYQEFRKLVFEQRAIVKEVDPSFNWGAMIANQPLHILKALGLDIMM